MDRIELGTQDSDQCACTRRQAIGIIVRGGIVLICGAIAEHGAAAPQWVAVGRVSRFKVGIPTRVTAKPGVVAFVIRQRNNRWLALSASCTHAGATIEWDRLRGRFVCPLHKATFGPDGKNPSGPAKGPLAQYPTQVNGNDLRLDLSSASAGGHPRGRGRDHEEDEEEEREHERGKHKEEREHEGHGHGKHDDRR